MSPSPEPLPTECDRVRTGASAQLDGEDPGVPAAAITGHVAACPGCAAHVAAITRLDRAMRVRPAGPVPDLVATVTASVAADRHRRRARQRLAVVGVAGVVMGVLALLALVAPDIGHAGREVAVFELVVAGVLVATARRPSLVHVAFPIVAVLALVLVATAAVDLATGATVLLAEVAHLPPVLAAVLLWPRGGPRPRAASQATA